MSDSNENGKRKGCIERSWGRYYTIQREEEVKEDFMKEYKSFSSS